jgi:hypothetical protein
MQLQRDSVGEVQRQVDEGLAQKRAELAVATRDLKSAQDRHEELQREIKKWAKQLENE